MRRTANETLGALEAAAAALSAVANASASEERQRRGEERELWDLPVG